MSDGVKSQGLGRQLARCGFLVLLLAWPSSPLWAGAPEDRAREQWMNGYVKLEEAMRAENANNPVAALQLYREAGGIFTRVRTAYPEWNRSLLDYRVNYCAERCRRLEQGVAAQQSTLGREALTTLVATQRQQLQQLERDNQGQKQKLELTAQALERARAEAAAAGAALAERDTLLRGLREAREAVKAAEGREAALKAAAGKAAAAADDDAPRLRRLTVELEEARARQAAAEQKASSTQAALQHATDQLRQARRQAEEARGEADGARRDAAEAAAAGATAATRLAEQEKQAGATARELDTLKRELARQRTAAEQAVAEQRRLTQERDQERARRAAAAPGAAPADELSLLRDTLTARDQECITLRQRIGTVERQLADGESAQADRQAQAAARQAEMERLNAQLDTLQKRNQALKEAEARAKLERDRAVQSNGLEQARAAEARATAAETALADLQKQQAAMGETVRRQEVMLRELEARTRAPAAAAQGGGELADCQARLKESLAERDRARRELAEERQRRLPGADPFSEELRRVMRELDAEREKRTALEAALAKTAAARPAAAPAPAAGQPADRASLVAGFLRQGAQAESQGRSETAVWNYRQALEQEPRNALALKRLGLIAVQAGDAAEAEKQLRLAFYANPDDVDVLVALGHTLVREQKADLALSMLARAVDLRPDAAALHRAYGIACASLGWLDAAEAQLRRALALDAKDREAAFNLAVLLASRQPPALDEARRLYRQARDLGLPPDPGLDRVLAP
ncbi:MAG: hypothetical protein WC708_10595 [Lentisphaeria bacterium]